jgi:hypothetical protein
MSWDSDDFDGDIVAKAPVIDASASKPEIQSNAISSGNIIITIITINTVTTIITIITIITIHSIYTIIIITIITIIYDYYFRGKCLMGM